MTVSALFFFDILRKCACFNKSVVSEKPNFAIIDFKVALKSNVSKAFLCLTPFSLLNMASTIHYFAQFP